MKTNKTLAESLEEMGELSRAIRREIDNSITIPVMRFLIKLFGVKHENPKR